METQLNDFVEQVNSSARRVEYVPQYQLGWVCPKCGRVYSPSTSLCIYCQPYTVTCKDISWGNNCVNNLKE